MRNSLVAEEFAKGATMGMGSNLSIDGMYIKSYSTIIGERVKGGVRLNKVKYSCTTSKHQTYLRRACEKYNVKVVEEYIPQNRRFGL